MQFAENDRRRGIRNGGLLDPGRTRRRLPERWESVGAAAQRWRSASAHTLHRRPPDSILCVVARRAATGHHAIDHHQRHRAVRGLELETVSALFRSMWRAIPGPWSLVPGPSSRVLGPRAEDRPGVRSEIRHQRVECPHGSGRAFGLVKAAAGWWLSRSTKVDHLRETNPMIPA